MIYFLTVLLLPATLTAFDPYTSGLQTNVLETRNSSIPELQPRLLGGTQVMVQSMVSLNGNQVRQFLQKYGCYCYVRDQTFVGSVNQYNGPGLDEFDELCRELDRKQRCLVIDSNNGHYEKPCSKQTKLENIDYYRKNGRIRCGREKSSAWAKNNPCKLSLCFLEREFAEKVAALIRSGYKKTWKYRQFTEEEYAQHCPPYTNAHGVQMIPGVATTPNDVNNVLNNNRQNEYNVGNDYKVIDNNIMNKVKITKPKVEPGVKMCCGVNWDRNSYDSNVKQCCHGVISDIGTC